MHTHATRHTKQPSFSAQHTHPSRGAGACVLTGCEEIAAGHAANEVSRYIRFKVKSADVGMLYMFTKEQAKGTEEEEREEKGEGEG